MTHAFFMQMTKAPIRHSECTCRYKESLYAHVLSVLLRIGSYSIITRVYSQMTRVHAMTNTHMKATLNNRTLYDMQTEMT